MGIVFTDPQSADGKTKPQNVHGQKCMCLYTQIGSATWVSANWDVSLYVVSYIQPTYVSFGGRLVRAKQLLGINLTAFSRTK